MGKVFSSVFLSRLCDDKNKFMFLYKYLSVIVIFIFRFVAWLPVCHSFCHESTLSSLFWIAIHPYSLHIDICVHATNAISIVSQLLCILCQSVHELRHISSCGFARTYLASFRCKSRGNCNNFKNVYLPYIHIFIFFCNQIFLPYGLAYANGFGERERERESSALSRTILQLSQAHKL